MFHRLFVVSTFALAVVFSGPIAGGQSAASRQSVAAQRMQKLAQQLQLSEPQKEKIMPILVEEAPKMKAIRTDTTLSENDKVVRMMQVRNETNDKIRPILTPAQQHKLDEMKQQERQHFLQELKTQQKPS